MLIGSQFLHELLIETITIKMIFILTIFCLFQQIKSEAHRFDAYFDTTITQVLKKFITGTQLVKNSKSTLIHACFLSILVN